MKLLLAFLVGEPRGTRSPTSQKSGEARGPFVLPFPTPATPGMGTGGDAILLALAQHLEWSGRLSGQSPFLHRSLRPQQRDRRLAGDQGCIDQPLSPGRAGTDAAAPPVSSENSSAATRCCWKHSGGLGFVQSCSF